MSAFNAHSYMKVVPDLGSYAARDTREGKQHGNRETTCPSVLIEKKRAKSFTKVGGLLSRVGPDRRRGFEREYLEIDGKILSSDVGHAQVHQEFAQNYA